MPQSKWLKEKLGLTAVEESFCRHYIANRCNAGEAYIKASPNEIKRSTARDKAYKLLKRDDIRARVTELMQKYLAELDLSASDVVQELSRVATTTIKDIADWNEAGIVAIIPSAEIGLREASALKAIKSTTRTMPQKDGEPIVEVKLEVIMNDKLKALELLGKFFNMFAEKQVAGEKDLDAKLKRALKRAEKKKAGKILKMVPSSGNVNV